MFLVTFVLLLLVVAETRFLFRREFLVTREVILYAFYGLPL